MDLGFVGIQLAATAHYSKKADPRYPLNPLAKHHLLAGLLLKTVIEQ
jgi:hypothetical protein